MHQGFSVGKRVAVGAVTAAMAAVLTLGGLIAKWATDDSVPVAEATAPPAPVERAPIRKPPAARPVDRPRIVPPAPFASDDRGFIDSSARCQGPRSAFAIGRTRGSLMVICAEPAGRYEYVGVRLRDKAVLRAGAENHSARRFLAQKAGVVYAVSPTELEVTTGNTVIKREPMIEYREVSR